MRFARTLPSGIRPAHCCYKTCGPLRERWTRATSIVRHSWAPVWHQPQPHRAAGDGNDPHGLATGAAGRPPRRRRARHVIQSLAVLPLVNRSGDAELDYLSDGVAESLINDLSQIPRLRVMRAAPSSVTRESTSSAGRGPAARRAGGAHGPRRRAAGAFVVAAELVDVDDGSELRGSALNRPVADGFALQAEMSEGWPTPCACV